MSSSDNDLYKLGNLIDLARADLIEAEKLATHLCQAYPENYDPGWPAMVTLCDQLLAINKLLDSLPDEEITKAIDDADANLEHLESLADRQSY